MSLLKRPGSVSEKLSSGRETAAAAGRRGSAAGAGRQGQEPRRPRLPRVRFEPWACVSCFKTSAFVFFLRLVREEAAHPKTISIHLIRNTLWRRRSWHGQAHPSLPSSSCLPFSRDRSQPGHLWGGEGGMKGAGGGAGGPRTLQVLGTQNRTRGSLEGA